MAASLSDRGLTCIGRWSAQLFIPNHVSDLLPVNISIISSQLMRCVAGIKFKMSKYFSLNSKTALLKCLI